MGRELRYTEQEAKKAMDKYNRYLKEFGLDSSFEFLKDKMTKREIDIVSIEVIRMYTEANK